MRHLPTILLVFALPAGIVGYAIGATLVAALLPGETPGFLDAFVALFVAGLCMVPFLLPFIDRKAKADLASHRRDMAIEAGNGGADDEAPDSPP